MKKLRLKINIKEPSITDQYMDYLNICDKIHNEKNNTIGCDDFDKDDDIKIKIFYFIIKLSIKYLTKQQRDIFLKVWLFNRGDKKFNKNNKKYVNNWIFYKMALKNLQNIIFKTQYCKYIERLINENR